MKPRSPQIPGSHLSRVPRNGLIVGDEQASRLSHQARNASSCQARRSERKELNTSIHECSWTPESLYNLGTSFIARGRGINNPYHWIQRQLDRQFPPETRRKVVINPPMGLCQPEGMPVNRTRETGICFPIVDLSHCCDAVA